MNPHGSSSTRSNRTRALHSTERDVVRGASGESGTARPESRRLGLWNGRHFNRFSGMNRRWSCNFTVSRRATMPGMLLPLVRICRFGTLCWRDRSLSAGWKLMSYDPALQFEYSVESDASPGFAWSYWTNIDNWADPPAQFS